MRVCLAGNWKSLFLLNDWGDRRIKWKAGKNQGYNYNYVTGETCSEKLLEDGSEQSWCLTVAAEQVVCQAPP